MYKADNREEYLRDMQDSIAGYLPTNKETESVLDAAAAGVADLDSVVEQAQRPMDPQKADSIEELRPFGEIVDVQPDTSRPPEVYQKRILAKYQQLSLTGRPNEILDFISSLFNLDPNQITLTNPSGEPFFRVDIPKQVLSNVELTESEVSALLENISAASIGARIQRVGTLDYITESERNNNYDSTEGYATLDADGNITSGGTYGTVY